MPTVSAATNPFTEHAGRLGTRCRRGGPGRRWADAVSDVQIYCEHHRQSSLQLQQGKKADKKIHAIQIASLSGPALEKFDEAEGEADGEAAGEPEDD